MFRIGLIILVISSFIALCYCYEDEVPEGFSLSVYHDCGPSPEDNQPIISIITDLAGAGAIAHCRNGDSVFLTEDGIFHDLFPSLQDSPFFCVFDRLNNTNTYVLKVSVFWGDLAGSIDTHNREYVITCNFDKMGSSKSDETVMGDPVLAPKEISHNMGEKTTSELSLDLVNVKDEIITGTVQTDRYVRLIASTDGSNGEVGIKPVSCDVVGIPSGARHAIIRAGCGDGSVFTREEAFTTKGLKAYSPYFGAFQVNGDESVDFECNLTLCFENCDGSSCHNERRKRSELIHEFKNRRGGVYFIRSKPLKCMTASDIEIENKKAEKSPYLMKMKSNTLRFQTDEDYITKSPMWILITVLGCLVFVALLVSLYNCFNDVKPNRRPTLFKADAKLVETTGVYRVMCPSPSETPRPKTEALLDINMFTASSFLPCNIPVNKN